MNTRKTLLAAAAMALALAAPAIASGTAAAQDRTVVESAAQLPQFAYPLTVKPSLLIEDAKAFDALTTAMAKDAGEVLAKYDIRDRSAKDLFRGALRDIALLNGAWDKAAALTAEIAADVEKPAEKAMSGLLILAWIDASRQGGNQEARIAAYKANLEKRLAALDWAVVQDRAKAMKGQFEVLNPELIKGSLESQLDKVFEANPQASFQIGRGLIGARVTTQVMVPLKQATLDALTAYVDKHQSAAAAKPDIWQARDITFADGAKLTPVTVAIWDSGMDTGNYADRLFTNPKETANGKDDDGNGFVDDIHGIAFNITNGRATGDLLPISDDQRARVPELLDMVKGSLDTQANVDSPEAAAYKARLASLKRDEVKDFVQNVSMISLYLHGTHVAGIAQRGNPAARLMHVSMQWPYTFPPPAQDEAWAQGVVAAAKDAVAYMKANGVRVTNMSWRITRQMIQGNLEINGLEKDPKARQARADRIFGILQTGLAEAFASAPDILFVAGSGNEDQDINFVGSVPAGIDLPNVITVGAVDQAGDETGFTSVGASVDVHANGFQVDSLVPGKRPMKMNGTSMAAPQVTNLAAKLLAVKPDLTTEQLVTAIKGGADPAKGRGVNLINPKKSLERVAAG